MASPLLPAQKQATKEYIARRMTLQAEFAARAQMQQIKRVLLVYMQDNDSIFPTLSPMDTLVKELRTYRIQKALFLCPVGNQLYAGNKKAAGKRQKDFAKPNDVLLLWGTTAFADGSYLVLDAKLMDRKVSGGELARMKKVSGI